MRALLATALMLVTLLAQATTAPQLRPSVTGTWVLSAHAEAGVRKPCRITRLQFTRDGYLLRRSGKLLFKTTVQFRREAAGWLLTEKIVSDNGESSCSGQSAKIVLQQLAFNTAYIETDSERILYYRNTGDRKPLEFVRKGSVRTKR